MDLKELINHPERMDRDTLFELRSLLALYPYFQTARLLMLQNLYLLHDTSFDEELRRAAIYITDRKVLFNMIEAAHYQLRQQTSQATTTSETSANPNRTVDLIDSFLDTIPPEEEEDEKQGKRAPTPADATIDYVAYLLQCEANEKAAQEEQTPQMKGQSLIDSFLEQEQGRIMLNDLPSDYSIEEEPAEEPEDNEEEYFTETLARIYIKQGRYQKAYDIIGRLSNKYPQKNAYFADQMRFLEKLIINRTTDFIEKATWGLAAAMVIISVVCAWVAPTTATDSSVMENIENPVTNPNNLPGFGASQQKDATAPAAEGDAKEAAPAAEAPAAKTPAQPAN